MGLAACAADPIGIRVPDAVPVPSPMPPAPTPIPGGTLRLTPDVLFVIDSDVDVLVLVSPDGRVGVSHEAGPVKIRGKFIDNPDKTATRTFKGKHVYVLEPVADGQCEVLVVPVGAADAKSVVRRTVDVLTAPQPPPKPVDPVIPVPVNPAPIPEAGFRVLIVYESADRARYPSAQNAILTSVLVRDYFAAHCAKGPDGRTPESRIWDKDTDGYLDSKLWGDAMKRPRASVPWIVISTGTTGYEGPLPANVADALTLLKKYGGN